MWGRETAGIAKGQVRRWIATSWMTGASKFFRLVTQIPMLGVGAYLALDGSSPAA